MMIALLTLAVTARAGEVRFGHADWKASSTDPVGFAGQGNNWYPGATPPTEFWEGTPTKVKVKIGKRGAAFNYGEYPNEVEADGYADNQSRNIRWKVPVPGWSDSLPVVVGDKVVTLTSPHYVTCWDAETGKVVWQDELKLMTLPVLSADRKSIGPAPDPAKAAVAQGLFERTLGYLRVRIGATGFHRDRKQVSPADWAPRAPLLNHAISVLEQWQTELKADYPDIGPTLDGELALLRDCLAGKTDEQRKATGLKGYPIGSFAGKAPGVYSSAPDLQSFAAKKLGLSAGHLCNLWQGTISDTMATPVSDGAVVCVTFGTGQVGAYELATGKRLWAWRDPAMNAGSASHLPAPLLWKDLMIFMAAGKGNGYATTTMAVDKRTGAIRWEVSGGPGGSVWGSSHGDHMSPALVRLGNRAVVVTNKGGVLDAETGATLVQLPTFAGADARYDKRDNWRAGFVTGVAGRVYRASAGDNYGPPTSIWPLRFDGEKLAVEEGFVSEGKAGQGPFVLSDRLAVLGALLVDAATGKKIAALPGMLKNGAPALAGNHLIVARSDGDQREREDRMVLAKFAVFDVSDPAKPKLVSDRNLLGGAGLPSDIADKYFPEFRRPEMKQFAIGGYLGIGGYFGVRTSGVTAHGRRLYIQSQTHLYCVGEQ